MTKEQFLSGTPFYIGKKSYLGDSTYYYDNNIISRQTRSSIDEKVIIDTHECNIIKLGRIGFTAFTYVMSKKVVVKYRFSDLVPYIPEPVVGE